MTHTKPLVQMTRDELIARVRHLEAALFPNSTRQMLLLLPEHFSASEREILQILAARVGHYIECQALANIRNQHRGTHSYDSTKTFINRIRGKLARMAQATGRELTICSLYHSGYMMPEATLRNLWEISRGPGSNSELGDPRSHPPVHVPRAAPKVDYDAIT